MAGVAAGPLSIEAVRSPGGSVSTRNALPARRSLLIS
jgi:hypothetical protein